MLELCHLKSLSWEIKYKCAYMCIFVLKGVLSSVLVLC